MTTRALLVLLFICSGVVQVAAKFYAQTHGCQDKKRSLPPKPVDIRVGTWNVYRGFETDNVVSNFSSGRQRVVDGGISPPLNTFNDLRNLALAANFLDQEAVRPNERMLGPVMENLFQQITNEQIYSTVKRYRQIADVIGAEAPHVIALQECLAMKNTNTTKLPRASNTDQEHAWLGGPMSSPDFLRIDCAEVIRARLKSAHSLSYRTVARLGQGGSSGKRSLLVDEEGDVLMTAELTTAILVRKDVRTIDSDHPERVARRAFELRKTEIFSEDGDFENTTPLSQWHPSTGSSRGALVADLEFKGVQFRFITAHADSGSGFQFRPGAVARESIFFDTQRQVAITSSARRALLMNDIVTELVADHEHPVIFAGDINSEPFALAGTSAAFPATALLTMTGSLTNNGDISDTGGRFLSSLFEVFPNYADAVDQGGPDPFTTSGIRATSFVTKPLTMRRPDTFFRFINDHILIEDGKGAVIKSHRVLPVQALTQTEAEPFAWPSDHRLVLSDVQLPASHGGGYRKKGKSYYGVTSPAVVELRTAKSNAAHAQEETEEFDLTTVNQIYTAFRKQTMI